MKLTKNLRYDFPASIVVLFVAVPLCLGIALASGAPLFAGLIAGVIGGLVVGAISGSQLGVSGPAAGLAVIVFSAIERLGFEAFLVAVVLAGVIQILLGLARAGVIAYFFPSSVIKGMLAGIGVVIILKQIPHALGHDSDPEGELGFTQPDGETTFSSLSAMLGDLDPRAIFIAAVSLGILILWESVLARKARIFRLLQGPLVAVLFGIGYQAFTSRFAGGFALEPSHLVSVPIISGWSELSGLLTAPDWSRIGDGAVLLTAVTIAVVASLETLLCVEATDKSDPLKRITPTNRELVAQGCGNFVSGLIGGLPITQVIVRSSANIQSGGRSKMSTMLHGAFLALFVVALPHVLNLVPLAVLAAILLTVGYKLARPGVFMTIYKLGPAQFVPFLVTVLGIVLTDLLVGIGLGMAIAIFVILKRSYRNSHCLHLKEADTADQKHVVTIKLAEEVTFLNKGAIVKSLSAIPEGSQVTVDATDSVNIDYDVWEAINEFREVAESRNISLHFVHDEFPSGASFTGSDSLQEATRPTAVS